MKVFDWDESCPFGYTKDNYPEAEQATATEVVKCRSMKPTGEMVPTSCCGGKAEKIYCANSGCVADRVARDLPPYTTRNLCTKSRCNYFSAE